MQEIGVALLAQEGNRGDKESILIRPMRGMAIQATLANRGMFEQERAAFLGMTLVAGLVDGVRLQQGIGERAVRIVAIVAAHLPLGQRHV